MIDFEAFLQIVTKLYAMAYEQRYHMKFHILKNQFCEFDQSHYVGRDYMKSSILNANLGYENIRY